MPTSLDTYAPFDAGAGANVTEATWRDFMRHMLGSASGVIRGFLNEFAVTADNSGMNVKVDTGECWIRGHYGKSTAQKTLSIAAAHATLARKDRVILRADFTNNRVEVDVLTGTAASSPVVPAVTQSTTIWETSLAIVDIPAADTAIASTQITDNRVYTSAQAKYSRLSGQSIPNAAYQLIGCDNPVTISGDVRANGDGTITLLRSGLWVLTAWVQYAANATGKRELIIADPAGVSGANSTMTYGSQTCAAVSGVNVNVSCTAVERFAVNKTVGAHSYQNSGASLSIGSDNPNHPMLSAVWVGP